MNRFSQKQTKNSNIVGKTLSDRQSVMRLHKVAPKSAIVNKFKGMSENLEWFEPVLIPGYINIG